LIRSVLVGKPRETEGLGRGSSAGVAGLTERFSSLALVPLIVLELELVLDFHSFLKEKQQALTGERPALPQRSQTEDEFEGEDDWGNERCSLPLNPSDC
jgi:hypothetical protein